MNEEEVREAYFELKVIEEQMKQLQQQINNIENNIAEFDNSVKSLDELKEKTGEETFVPVSAGIYAKAKLEDTENFVVNVGAGVAVRKNREETQRVIRKQIDEMRQYREQMLKGLQLLGARAEEIERSVSQG